MESTATRYAQSTFALVPDACPIFPPNFGQSLSDLLQSARDS